MKKIFAFLSGVCLLFTSALPVSAAEMTFQELTAKRFENSGVFMDTFGNEQGTWTLDTSTGVLTISGTDSMLREAPWSGNPNIQTVIIENGIEYVDGTVFSECENLTSISIPESVYYAGDFSGCPNLQEINVDPQNADYKSIDGVLFDSTETILEQYPLGKPETEYTIPDSVESIDFRAFENCANLTSVFISENVNEIASTAFLHCTGLTNIEVAEGNETYFSTDGVLFERYQTYNDYDIEAELATSAAKTSINLLQYPIGRTETEYTVPENTNTISEYAFDGCSALTSVFLPKSLQKIGSNQGNAFSDCPNLTSIEVDEQNIYLTSKEGVLFNKPMTELIEYPKSKPETEYAIPDKVNLIDSTAFKGNPYLYTLYIPESVKEISNADSEFLSGCSNLAFVHVDENNSVFSSENGILLNKSKTFLYICPPNNSTTEYIMPDTVKEFNPYAFAGCTALTSVSISPKVERIDENAFENCSHLETVTLPENLKYIEIYAFAGCSSLKEIALPETLEVIWNCAFTDCSSLTSVSIPEKVRIIGDYAFSFCTNLETVTLPENLTNIGLKAFWGTAWIKKNPMLIIDHVLIDGSACEGDVTIPEEVTTIGENAFDLCSTVTSVTIPENVTWIRADAFRDCENLETVTIQSPYCRVEEHEFTIPDNATIYSYPDSYAENYAQKYHKNFTPLDENPAALYDIKPLLAPFSGYFFVKTDDPDPTSFRFVDSDSKYAEEAIITASSERFADVQYENPETLRVNGGYIFYRNTTDGGEVSLQVRKSGSTWIDAGLTFTLPELCDEVDYLIQNYATKDNFFENMQAVQDGLKSICLYSASYIRGDFAKTQNFWHVSTSPHIDQHFYLLSPYSYQNNQALFASTIYPYLKDSISFPSLMSKVAERLDNSVSWKWSDSAHYLIDVTYHGETRSFGGAGNFPGQALTENELKKIFTFDEEENFTLEEIQQLLKDYSETEMLSDIPEENKLTWKAISDTVGNGSWVRISDESLISDGSWEVRDTCYTYLFRKDNEDSYSVSHWGVGYENYWSGSLGFVSDTWVDGRYIDQYEKFVPGETFDQHPKSNILLLGTKIPVLNGTEITETTGNLLYCYNEKENLWMADLPDYQKILDLDESYSDLLQLTLEEVETLDVDRNTNQIPESGYLYDGTAEPATIFENEKIYQKGDPDGNGEIDIRDVILVNRAILGKSILSENQLNAVDFNGDGKLELTESITIMKYIVRSITEFP